MLIHLHNRAIIRHWSEEHRIVRHWFKNNGDDNAEGSGGDPDQLRACIGAGRALRHPRADRLKMETPGHGA